MVVAPLDEKRISNIEQGISNDEVFCCFAGLCEDFEPINLFSESKSPFDILQVSAYAFSLLRKGAALAGRLPYNNLHVTRSQDRPLLTS
jgi:hypothetical protein